MAVNATGSYLVTKAFLPGMLDAGWCRIVNMSAERGGGVFGKVPYSAAKAANLRFTKALAREIASSGVTINSVTPGAVDTNIRVGATPESEAKLTADIPAPPAAGSALPGRLRSSRPAEQGAANLAFHEALCTASGNRTLVESWRRVSGLARAVITAAGRETAIANVSAARHAPIVDAIASGDAAHARGVLREHNTSARDSIVARMEAALAR